MIAFLYILVSLLIVVTAIQGRLIQVNHRLAISELDAACKSFGDVVRQLEAKIYENEDKIAPLEKFIASVRLDEGDPRSRYPFELFRGTAIGTLQLHESRINGTIEHVNKYVPQLVSKTEEQGKRLDSLQKQISRLQNSVNDLVRERGK